jgi:hypothetical protein
LDFSVLFLDSARFTRPTKQTIEQLQYQGLLLSSATTTTTYKAASATDTTGCTSIIISVHPI